MKTKNIIFGGVSILAAVIGIVSLFLPCWNYTYNDSTASSYTIFGGFKDNVTSTFKLLNGSFNGVWAILALILALIAVIALITAATFFVLDYFKILNNKLNEFVEKIAAIVAIAAGALAFVLGVFVFNMTNTVVQGNLVIEMKANCSLFFLLLGSLLGGICTLLSIKDYKK